MRNKKYVGKRKMIEILRKELGRDAKAKDCRYEKYHGSEWLKFYDWTGNEKCGFHNCDDNNYEIYSSGRISPVFEEEKSEAVEEMERKEIEK